MSTNNDTIEPAVTGEGSTPTETPPPAGNAPRVFSQEEVDRIAAKAREDGRKSALKTTPATPAVAMPAPTPQPAPQASDEGERLSLRQLNQRLEESEMRRAFDKRAAKRGLEDAVADELFEIYKVQKPSDPDDWFEKKSLLFGFKPPGTSAAPTAAPAPAPTPVVAPTPAAAPAAPNGASQPVTSGGILDIFNLTPQQLAQLGSAGVRAELDKARAYHHQSSGLARLPKVPERK